MERLTDERGNVYQLGSQDTLFGDPDTEAKIKEYLSLIKTSPSPQIQNGDWCLYDDGMVYVWGVDKIDSSRVLEVRSPFGEIWHKEMVKTEEETNEG